MKIGDYVLATKYEDGDPMDPHVVGYIDNIYCEPLTGDRVFRINGRRYRRAELITPEQGTRLCALFPEISDRPGPSLWEQL